MTMPRNSLIRGIRWRYLSGWELRAVSLSPERPEVGGIDPRDGNPECVKSRPDVRPMKLEVVNRLQHVHDREMRNRVLEIGWLGKCTRFQLRQSLKDRLPSFAMIDHEHSNPLESDSLGWPQLGPELKQAPPLLLKHVAQGLADRTERAGDRLVQEFVIDGCAVVEELETGPRLVAKQLADRVHRAGRYQDADPGGRSTGSNPAMSSALTDDSKPMMLGLRAPTPPHIGLREHPWVVGGTGHYLNRPQRVARSVLECLRLSAGVSIGGSEAAEAGDRPRRARLLRRDRQPG